MSARAPRLSSRWRARCTASSPPSDEGRISLCERKDPIFRAKIHHPPIPDSSFLGRHAITAAAALEPWCAAPAPETRCAATTTSLGSRRPRLQLPSPAVAPRREQGGKRPRRRPTASCPTNDHRCAAPASGRKNQPTTPAAALDLGRKSLSQETVFSEV